VQNIGGGQIQYGPPNQIIGGAMAPLAPPIAPPMSYRLLGTLAWPMTACTGNWANYYRATRIYYELCRRKMSDCPSVCPSVCLHTPVYFRHGWTYPQFVYRQVAHYPSFATPNGMAILRREPPHPTGASNAKGYEKVTIFYQYLTSWNMPG